MHTKEETRDFSNNPAVSIQINSHLQANVRTWIQWRTLHIYNYAEYEMKGGGL